MPLKTFGADWHPYGMKFENEGKAERLRKEKFVQIVKRLNCHL